MHTGWLEDDGVWYYMNAKGVMVTGTVRVDGRINIFDASGVWVGYGD